MTRLPFRSIHRFLLLLGFSATVLLAGCGAFEKTSQGSVPDEAAKVQDESIQKAMRARPTFHRR